MPSTLMGRAFGIGSAALLLASGCGAPLAPPPLVPGEDAAPRLEEAAPPVDEAAAAAPDESGRFTTLALSPAQAAAAYAARPSMLGSGMAGPNGLALDKAGNLYEADWNRGSVTKVSPSGATSRYASGISGAAGLAFDAAGALYVAAYNGHTLQKIPPGGGSHATFVWNGLKRPVWPAIDKAGRIYLADYSNNRIAKIAPNGTATTFVSLTGVNAIAIDPQDNLWVTTWGGRVVKVAPNGAQTTIASGLSTACGIAWSPGYLAVVTYGGERGRNGRLVLVDFAGKSYQVATGLDRASSVIFDRQLNIYTANVGDSGLRKFSLGGGVPAPASAAPSKPPSPKPPTPKPGGPIAPPGIVYQTGLHDVIVGPGGSFTPARVYVRPGATTRFINRDSKPHTVTGFGGATSNSGPLRPGGSYLHNWQHPGTWTFHDALTPNGPVFTLIDVPR